jgi:hypothetical protein
MPERRTADLFYDEAEDFAREVPLNGISAGEYAHMRWPRLLPLLRFGVRCFAAPSFGNITVMRTRSLLGLMKLSTTVFIPNRGVGAPLLLTDVMTFGGKSAVFAEFYDLTAGGVCTDERDAAELYEISKKYRTLPDYPEKPAWYVQERAPYSLIKGGKDRAALAEMLGETVRVYSHYCAGRAAQPPQADAARENLKGIAAFAGRMVILGNPSRSILEKTLGARGAENFFRNIVMPVRYRDE